MRHWISLGLALSLVPLGCLSLGSGAPSAVDPARPALATPADGFTSLEGAAIAALRYAESRVVKGSEFRMRGGTVYRKGSKYYFTAPQVAPREAPHSVIYPLRPQDVAHYSVYPQLQRAGTGQQRFNPGPRYRQFVEQVDPHRRPIFVLTPERKIQAYGGVYGWAGSAEFYPESL